MPASTWIEIAGYIGSALVLVSFLMTSVVKLRIVNMVGSFISCTYALIIASYPLAIMNFALILINLHFLWKVKHAKRDYHMLEVGPEDPLLAYYLKEYAEDINSCFPGMEVDPSQADLCCLLLSEDTPAGLVLAKREGAGLHLLLDYSMPKFRDYSLGPFMAQEFQKQGFQQLRYSGPDVNHRKYLTRMAFCQDSEGVWVKSLQTEAGR